MKPTGDQERLDVPQSSGWRATLSLGRIWAGLAEQFRLPLVRNGYALLFGSGTTSAIGLAYWVLAARLYPPEILGLNSALLSAMLLLAGMGQLGVNNALIRFIPQTGRDTTRLIVFAYAIAVGIAALASTIFYLGIADWAPALSFVAAAAPWRFALLAAVIAWCIFTLQDNVLTGLRQAVWVPIENTVFSVLKIVLLVAFAKSLPGYGILLSWVIPAVLLIPPINGLIFGRLLPAHDRSQPRAEPPPAPGKIFRFGAGNFVGSLFFVLYNTFLPVLVVDYVGVSANAYFYLPWTIASSIQLIGLSLASSLVVEAALDPTQLKAYAKRILVSSFGLLAPIALLILIGAPFLLQIYGPAYAAAGALLLRLLVIAAFPSTLVAVAIGLMRARNRNWQIMFSQGALCAVALGLAYALLPHYGINGVGIAWLVAQTAAALFLLATEVWPLFRSRSDAAGLDQYAPAEARSGPPLPVSVIINNYNYARYLAQAIDSALSQVAVPVEVIVVDDGSTDHSREIITAYGDRIVPVFKANGGQASAVNLGFAHSHGAVVIFLDADDILLPMAAARVAGVFATAPGTAKVQYRMRVIDALGRETGEVRPPPRIPLHSGDLHRQEVSFPFDLPWAALSANAFSAAVLKQILPIPVERYDQAGADWYLAHVSALWGEVCALDDVCALYRVHGANRYARAIAALDLDSIRQTVRYAAATRDFLQQFADQRQLARPHPILSVSDVAGRLTSLRLCPERHPFRGETVPGLVALGLRASARRFDVRWPTKLLFMAWFMAVGLLPAGPAEKLAEAFFVPERRRPLNAWLGRLWRDATA